MHYVSDLVGSILPGGEWKLKCGLRKEESRSHGATDVSRSGCVSKCKWRCSRMLAQPLSTSPCLGTHTHTLTHFYHHPGQHSQCLKLHFLSAWVMFKINSAVLVLFAEQRLYELLLICHCCGLSKKKPNVTLNGWKWRFQCDCINGGQVTDAHPSSPLRPQPTTFTCRYLCRVCHSDI